MTDEELDKLTDDIRRRAAFSVADKLMEPSDKIMYLSMQVDDPRVKEAYRHLSYAKRLLFLYGNSLDTAQIPDFKNWERDF